MYLRRRENLKVNDQVTIVWNESQYWGKIGEVTIIEGNTYTVRFYYDKKRALFFRNHLVKYYYQNSSSEAEQDSDGNEIGRNDNYHMYQDSDGHVHDPDSED